MAGVAQWVKYWPVNQKVTGLIPSQGVHAWVVGQVPVAGAWERRTHINVSLPLFLSPFPSLWN